MCDDVDHFNERVENASLLSYNRATFEQLNYIHSNNLFICISERSQRLSSVADWFHTVEKDGVISGRMSRGGMEVQWEREKEKYRAQEVINQSVILCGRSGQECD